MNKLFGIGALAVAFTASGALAQTWAEVGDAGQGAAGTAQSTAPGGPGALATITGTFVGGATNPDMYLISITSPGTFSASTVGGTTTDTQLFLFTAAGMGIATNDDSVGLQSTLPAGNPLYSGLPTGLYILAVSNFDADPSSAGGLIFPGTFPGVFGPTGPGGGSPVASWGASGTTGAYTIFLTGAAFAPAPGTLALLGLAGFASRRRRA